MDRVIHFTTEKKFEQIQKERVLRANSQIDGFRYVKRLEDISVHDKYLVAIPETSCFNWQEYGFGEDGLRHRFGNVCLRVPILRVDGAFVRDIVYVSPQTFEEEIGFELKNTTFWNILRYGIRYMLWLDFGQRKKYYNSTIRLSDYKDDYKMPEFWLPQDTPLDLIEVVKKGVSNN